MIKVVDDLRVAGSIHATDQGRREVEGSTEVFHIAIFVGTREEGEELSQEVVLGIVDGVAEELRERELRVGVRRWNGGRRGTLASIWRGRRRHVRDQREDGREGS